MPKGINVDDCAIKSGALEREPFELYRSTVTLHCTFNGRFTLPLVFFSDTRGYDLD